MSTLPRYRISAILERDGNNLDLVRLVCAVLVIYGHAFALIPVTAEFHLRWDPSLRLGYAGIYAASIAVKIFFFISGLLVTNSLLTRRSVPQFILSRFFRIWPGLAAVVLAAAFVIGPLFTTVDRADYFRSYTVYHHVIGHLLMQSPGALPGVFLHNPLPSLVNGALWSLGFEVCACIGILILGLLGVLRRPMWCALVLLVVMADPVMERWALFPWIGSNPQFTYLPACFALGAFLAVMKDRITLGPVAVLGLTALFVAVRHTVAGPLAFFGALFGLVLYVSALPWVRQTRPASDLSYGIFLWGFPVQQMLVATFPAAGFFIQLFAALAISSLLAFLSWRLVEGPALDYGRRVGRRWTGKDSPSSAHSHWVLAWRRPLGLGPRLALALTLGVVPIACVLAFRTIGSAADAADNPPQGLSRLQAWTLDLEPPAIVSFKMREVRALGARQVLILQPPAQLTWILDDESIRSVTLDFGFHPDALTQGSTDGAEIILELEGKAHTRRVFFRRLEAQTVESDRGLQHTNISLPPFEAGARLVLQTTPGESGNNAWDWLYLAHFGFARGGDYAAEHLPGFEHLPARITGDSTGTIPSPDGTPAVFFSTPSVLEFRLQGVETTLHFDYGFFAGAYENGGRTDGALFRVELAPKKGEKSKLFEVSLNPVDVDAHRGLQRTEVALPAHAVGDTLVLSILPGGNGAWDQIYIQRLTLH